MVQLRESKDAKVALKSGSTSGAAKTGPKKPPRRDRLERAAARRSRAASGEAKPAKEALPKLQKHERQLKLDHQDSGTLSVGYRAKSVLENDLAIEKEAAVEGGSNFSGLTDGLDAPAGKVEKESPASRHENKEEVLQSKVKEVEGKKRTKKDASQPSEDPGEQQEAAREKKRSEAKRKAELTEKIALTIRRTSGKSPVSKKKAVPTFTRSRVEPSAKMSDVAGFKSLQNVLGRKAGSKQAAIEKADATQLEILGRMKPMKG